MVVWLTSLRVVSNGSERFEEKIQPIPAMALFSESHKPVSKFAIAFLICFV
jgi:hypothetical protein